MNVESRGQSVGDNLVRSYPDLGSSNAGKESADLKDGQLIELGSDIKKAYNIAHKFAKNRESLRLVHLE